MYRIKKYINSHEVRESHARKPEAARYPNDSSIQDGVNEKKYIKNVSVKVRQAVAFIQRYGQNSQSIKSHQGKGRQGEFVNHWWETGGAMKNALWLVREAERLFPHGHVLQVIQDDAHRRVVSGRR